MCWATRLKGTDIPCFASRTGINFCDISILRRSAAVLNTSDSNPTITKPQITQTKSIVTIVVNHIKTGVTANYRAVLCVARAPETITNGNTHTAVTDTTCCIKVSKYRKAHHSISINRFSSLNQPYKRLRPLTSGFLQYTVVTGSSLNSII